MNEGIRDVVVVGGAAAGLAIASELRRRGIDVVVLERDTEIGAVWARRYERLRLHTHRALSGLPGKDIDAKLPRYVGKDDVARYLADYAEWAKLDVRTGTEVRSLARRDDIWSVVTAGGVAVRAREVVVATGQYAEPVVPDLEGVQHWSGRIVLASEYRSGADFVDQRVLVVGVGNTGAELAVDLVEQGAAGVTVSVRTVPPIARLDLPGGISSHVVGVWLLSRLPRRWAQAMFERARRAGPDLSPWGLETPGWRPYLDQRPPVIDVGFVEQLERGSIAVRGPVDHLDAREVVFADGTREPFDAIVLATGYRTGLERLLSEDADLLGARGMPDLEAGAQRGLTFVGFDVTMRGQLFEIARRSRRDARRIARRLQKA